MASTVLTWDPASGSVTNKWTYSCWFKKSRNQTAMNLCSATSTVGGGITYTQIVINSDDTISFFNSDGGSTDGYLRTTGKYQDLNGWYHIVCVWDPTNGTTTDKMKMYINGVEPSFGTDNAPSGNSTIGNTYVHALGCFDSNGDGTPNTEYLDGYMTQSVMANGSILAVTTFGSFDGTTGEWKPKSDGEIRSAVTWSGNSWLLPFSNASNLGYDYQTSDRSGTTNDFTKAGEGYQTQANPSNNFCTWNSLYETPGTGGTLDLNNPYGLTYFGTSNQQKNGLTGTLGLFGGKWYWEGKVVNPAGTSQGISGVVNTVDASKIQQNNEFPGQNRGAGYSLVDGDTFVDGTQASYGNSLSKDDFFAIALDLDNKAMYFSKNGTWQNSGDPTSGATKTGAIDISAAIATGDLVLPTSGDGSGSQHTYTAWNFGDGYFKATGAGASNADDNGQGIFKYDVPAGYYAICTKNIKAYGG